MVYRLTILLFLSFSFISAVLSTAGHHIDFAEHKHSDQDQSHHSNCCCVRCPNCTLETIAINAVDLYYGSVLIEESPVWYNLQLFAGFPFIRLRPPILS